MGCEYTSNWIEFLRAKLFCLTFMISFLGGFTSRMPVLLGDDLPSRAAVPDAGEPPAPSTENGDFLEDEGGLIALRPYAESRNLRFRATPLRENRFTESASLLGEPASGVNTEMKPESVRPSVRRAGAGGEKEWQVEHDNPLRKNPVTQKGSTPPATVRPPLAAPLPAEAKTSSEKEAVAELAITEKEPPSPSDESMASQQDATAAVSTATDETATEETVLHFGDEAGTETAEPLDGDAQSAPLPPGMSPQTKSKSKSVKGFDPEDNDQPPASRATGSAADSESASAQTGSDSSEPQSSELLKLIQENPSLEVSNSSNAKSVNGSSKSAPRGNDLNPGSTNSSGPNRSGPNRSGPSNSGPSNSGPAVSGPVTSNRAQPDRAQPNSSQPNSSQPKSVVPMAARQPIKVLPQTARLRPRIDAALNYYLLRPESTVERSPWAVFHAILPYGSETTLRADGRTVSAINWMCFNGSCRGQRIFLPQPDGSFQPAVGAGVQGHDGQFLAILAQSRVPANYPLQVGRKRYTLEDLIDYEMRTCQAKTELTFKLIALSHYLINDATWVNDQGEAWSIERLVEEELAQPIIGSACGGTHRLMGLSYALKQRKAAGLPLDGQYARAEVFLKDFVDYAWTLQNPDGSFSTEWFEGRGNKQDLQRKLQTTGHIVEWLVFTLPDEELQSPRLLRSIEFLTYCLVEQRQTDWKIGPRSHALHALAMYQERLFGVTMGMRRNLANSASRNQRR